ncbi:MAG: hypothetical protein J7647_01285 [Cyanobacteria bacterium SBLK]|nr:hypothetical protein [Cyanobacteria bacterium SBLK]
MKIISGTDRGIRGATKADYTCIGIAEEKDNENEEGWNFPSEVANTRNLSAQ